MLAMSYCWYLEYNKDFQRIVSEFYHIPVKNVGSRANAMTSKFVVFQWAFDWKVYEKCDKCIINLG